MHEVEAELIKASKHKPAKKYAKRQDELAALVKSVDKLGDNEFDNLSDEAVNWFQQATEAMNSKSEIPDFDDPIEEPTEESEPDVTDEELTEPDEENEDEEVIDDDEGEDAIPEDHEADADVSPSDNLVSDDKEEPPVKRTKAGKKAKKRGPKPIHNEARRWPPSRFDNVTGEKDRYGFFTGTKKAEVVKVFEEGATMTAVKKEYGDSYYQMLKQLVKEGHLVEKENSLIKVTHKDDLKKKGA